MEKKERNLNPKKVILGMSGGVDSSVSLLLLKEAGYEVIGVSLKYDTWKCSRRENVCCSKESFDLAHKIAQNNKVEHKIIDVSDLFSKEVIGYFKSELSKNRTPSPCVFCNPKVKFLSLLKYADQVGAQYVATGHYARIETAEIFKKNQLVLKKGFDKQKDQSYSLSFLNKEDLNRIIFPLGNLTKEEVYKIAAKDKSFKPYNKIKQSQDFCFLNSDDYEKFIDQELSPSTGEIIDVKGSKVGSHTGLMKFTLGQRKGIGAPGGPFYVVDKKSPDVLVVSRDLADSYKAKALLKPYNLIVEQDSDEVQADVKIRSQEQLHKATIKIKKDSLELTYLKPVSQLVPGQVAVMYIDDICLGAGVINEF